MTITEIEKYKIIKHLGKGAHGDVYLAHDRALDAIKAIKVLDVPDPKQFMAKLEEAQILHKCRHKHIVIVNEANIYTVDGNQKVVIDMEHLEHGCFEDVIVNDTISIHDSVNYVIDSLFALEHAHNQGILHRDIKPANIMLCSYGAKLSDFGLATVLGSKSAGSPKGYTTHMAPEYFKTKTTTELTDLFAMGITLFRACNYISDWRSIINNIPNAGKKIQDGKLVASIGHQTFVPNKIKRIINKSCAADPLKRYQSCIEMRQALEKVKPLIDWRSNDIKSWAGVCKKTNKNFTATITNKRTHKVEVKQNNRRIADKCKSFNCPDEAQLFVYTYIAETMYG